MSLSNEGNAILDGVPIADIVKNGECLILTLICKDARGEDSTLTNLILTFRQLYQKIGMLHTNTNPLK